MTGVQDKSFSIDQLGLGRVLNGTGGWTAFGAARVAAECMEAAHEISARPVDINELQDAASEAIAAAIGAESGMVVNCSAAGILVAVAACIVGTDVARAKRLPDAAGLRNGIVLQKSHNHDFGAPIDQMIRMGGGKVHEIGWCNQCEASDLDMALRLDPAAAFYVVSYETFAAGQLPLPLFLEKCRTLGVRSIVDIAGEQDPAHYLSLGADLVIISVHKQLGGLTAGVIAGCKTLIDACRAQMGGVGRPGKASKESIASTIAAMRSLPERSDRETAAAGRAEEIISAINAIPEFDAQPFGYCVPGEATNVRIGLNPMHKSIPIADVVHNLERGSPRVALRKDQLPLGYIVLNPRELDASDIALLPHLFRRALTANWEG